MLTAIYYSEETNVTALVYIHPFTKTLTAESNKTSGKYNLEVHINEFKDSIIEKKYELIGFFYDN